MSANEKTNSELQEILNKDVRTKGWTVVESYYSYGLSCYCVTCKDDTGIECLMFLTDSKVL